VLQMVIDTGELSHHLCKHAVRGSNAIEQQLIWQLCPMPRKRP
jgi:hypothetical protein